jgi:hypothetical protein
VPIGRRPSPCSSSLPLSSPPAEKQGLLPLLFALTLRSCRHPSSLPFYEGKAMDKIKQNKNPSNENCPAAERPEARPSPCSFPLPPAPPNCSGSWRSGGREAENGRDHSGEPKARAIKINAIVRDLRTKNATKSGAGLFFQIHLAQCKHHPAQVEPLFLARGIGCTWRPRYLEGQAPIHTNSAPHFHKLNGSFPNIFLCQKNFRLPPKTTGSTAPK